MVIAVDFDGTCVTHAFPNLGEEIGAAPVLKKLTDNGHQLILWTMRSDNNGLPLTDVQPEIEAIRGNFLQQAIDWFKLHNIPLYGIQRNPTQHSWTTSPKCYAQLYIDDAALGAPLIQPKSPSQRPYLNWVATEQLLKQRGIL